MKLDITQQSDEGGGEEDQSGQVLLSHLEICLKLATLHNLNNDAFEAPVTAICQTIEAALKSSPSVRLQCSGENFFLNSVRISIEFDHLEAIETVRVFFDACSIRELKFDQGFGINNFRAFLQAYQRHYQLFTLPQLPQDPLENMAFKTTVTTTESEKGGSRNLSPAENLIEKFSIFIVSVHQAIERLKGGRNFSLPTLRRLLQRVIQAAEDQTYLAVALTQSKRNNNTPAFQIASIAILVQILCKELKLDRTTMMELCICSILNGFDSAQESDSADDTAGHHGGLFGDKKVSLNPVFNIIRSSVSIHTIFRASKSIESQVPLNGIRVNNVTRLKTQEGHFVPDLASRLIAIPAAFQCLSNPSQGAAIMMPSQAMRFILDQSGNAGESVSTEPKQNVSLDFSGPRFDMRLAKTFANAIGLFPIGSSVRLRNGDIAIVVRAPKSPTPFSKPQVKIIQSATGLSNIIVDLATSSNEIVEAIDETEHGLNLPMLLLA
jgi:hypothetical protein